MKYLVSVCVAAALLAACGQKKEAAPPTDSQATATPSAPPAAEPAPAAGASVQLAATQGHDVTGSLTIAPMGEGVHFTGTLQGLPPNGEFGFHVHEKGDCSAPDASSAGAHLNPAGVDHGNPHEGAHHAGDMLNAKSDAQGTAQINAHVDGLSIGNGGATDVIGKAVVVHEKADDYKTQPSGNSGARIACGVINAVGM
ncbi:MAG TPA: superoxide dismutase family protein [Steroidobacteraceae bacterium]|nr:superoxide dismutase family protein [Steroidobacteraceae bacterium]